MKASFKIVGKKDHFKRLDKHYKRLMDAAEGGVKSGAELMKNYAKDIAPYLTGTFRRSIERDKVVVKGYKIMTSIGSNITDPPYPIWLEYGTSKMAAKPTFRRTLNEQEKAFLEEVKNFISIVY